MVFIYLVIFLSSGYYIFRSFFQAEKIERKMRSVGSKKEEKIKLQKQKERAYLNCFKYMLVAVLLILMVAMIRAKLLPLMFPTYFQ